MSRDDVGNPYEQFSPEYRLFELMQDAVGAEVAARQDADRFLARAVYMRGKAARLREALQKLDPGRWP